MTGRASDAATTLDTSPLEHLLWASRLVVRRWREGRSAPDEIALLDIALARAEFQDEYRRLRHEAAADRDRYKAALEAILDTPTNATVLNVQFIAKEALRHD